MNEAQLIALNFGDNARMAGFSDIRIGPRKNDQIPHFGFIERDLVLVQTWISGSGSRNIDVELLIDVLNIT